MKYFLIIPLILFHLGLSGQKNLVDSSSYTLYKNQVILYSDIGYRSSPFSIRYPFSAETDKLKFKHNLKTIMGFGIHYKWFALRIGFSLPGTIRPPGRFGNSKHLNLGLQFSIKNTFIDLDLRSDSGFVITDAYKWNDTLNSLTPNDLRPGTRTANLSANVWWFKSKNFHMTPVLGRVGHYNREEKTFYLKSTLNFFGAGNNMGYMIPKEFRDSLKEITFARNFAALDLGVVPGFAYVNRISNWQFSFFTGFGAVIQSKFYSTPKVTRGYLGLAPRIDLKLIGGYNTPKYFCHIVTDFDIKSIKFRNLKYRQTYYSIQLVGGIRLDKKK